MKKALIAILSFLYVTVASGVVVNIHYCMGNLSSVSYGYDKHSACDKCGMKERKGCCHTEFKVVKLQDAHQLVQAAEKMSATPVLLPVTPIDYTAGNLPAKSTLSLHYHSPPDKRVNEVYLHNLAFRI